MSIMMLAASFFLLFLTGGASSDGVCTYQDVLRHLNLTYDNKLFYMTRPVKNYKSVTEVNLDLLLYAILEMKEKDQIFVPYVWITMWWKNDYISWDPEEFCGIKYLSIPEEIMWKPDLTIEETTEKDKAPPSPYLTVTSKGNVELTNDQVLVSTCRMQVYKFPFDSQSCSLTFKSFIHADSEVKLIQYSDSVEATEVSQKLMRTQSEWLFINMTITTKTNIHYTFNQSVIIYTINMKRRSALYIVNFILPILFLLCLDMASFMISDTGGEKLGFKITVLLAVTVMQLILNEILPSSSNRIPLIAVYCTGIFSLMMLSLLESVLVMYLIGKDSAAQDDETDKDQTLSEDYEDKMGKASCDSCDSCHGCEGEVNKLVRIRSEFLSVAKEDSSSQLTEESRASETSSDELRKLIKTLTLLLNSKKEEEKPGYWANTVKRINKAFFICYIIAASMFLFYVFFNWIHEEDYSY